MYGKSPVQLMLEDLTKLEIVVQDIFEQITPLYVYRWNRCGRKGQLCRVTARGKLNSCRVEFSDGFVMITSRNALRKARVSA